MDDILSYVWGTIWKFGLLLVIIWMGMHFIINTDISEITKAYAEISATTGGFTKSLHDDLKEDLRKIGLDPKKTVINIKANTANGVDISNKAVNITPPGTVPYPSSPIYCPRGTKFTIEIYSTEKSHLNTALNFIGIKSNIKKAYSRKVYMSERVE